MNKELRLIHLKITAKCNLRCSFCGQWGENGNMHGRTITELNLANWLGVISDIKAFAKKQNYMPHIIIWGGEPLSSPFISEVLYELKNNHFGISLITNGVHLQKYHEVVNDTVAHLFVSIDGDKETHERLRRVSGIYDKIATGLALIDKESVETTCMLTICEDNIKQLVDFPEQAATLGFSKVLYQNLMYCTPEQSVQRKKLSKDYFGGGHDSSDPWAVSSFGSWIDLLPEALRRVEDKKSQNEYPIEVNLYPNELTSSNILDWFDPTKKIGLESPCEMPYRHLHIETNGDTHFCVDFNEYSLGNVLHHSIEDIFDNEAANQYRKLSDCHQAAVCERCPWYYKKELSHD